MIDLAAWSFAAFTHLAAAIRLLAVASRALWRQGKRPVFLRSPDAVEQSSESARNLLSTEFRHTARNMQFANGLAATEILMAEERAEAAS